VVAAVHKVIHGVISCQGTVHSLKVTEIEIIMERVCYSSHPGNSAYLYVGVSELLPEH
jgi:hypothetical protein